jgi:hypothetical protein
MNRNGIIVQNNIHSGKFIARSWQMHLFDNINHNVNILTHPVPSVQGFFLSVILSPLLFWPRPPLLPWSLF